MKKLATLLLAAGMVFGAATGASAIDFKAKGQWVMNFDLGGNGNFENSSYGYDGGQDNFEASQRVRLQLDAVASEALSGTVYFEIGTQYWGNASNGGALGADGKAVEVKQAYLDWIVPNTDLKLRMGIQGIALPSMFGSQILDSDMAGITASYAFNENVSLTAFWARLYNDNSNGFHRDPLYGNAKDKNYQDNLDLFSVALPMTFDGVKVTPWVAYGMMGKNTFNNSSVNADWGPGFLATDRGLSTATGPKNNGRDLNGYADVYMVGLTGEITMADPFRFAWDFNYAGINTGDSRANRAGWFGQILAEYKMDWGTPGLYAWYASGEDGDRSNGSERMIQFDNAGSEIGIYSTNAHPYLGERGCMLGYTQLATWGIGARIKDVSFVEGLKHTLRVNYFNGTNDKDGVRQWNTSYYQGQSVWNNLSTDESAVEIGLTNVFKIYENLEMYNDISYIALNLDDDLRKGSALEKDRADAWNVNVSFVYSF